MAYTLFLFFSFIQSLDLAAMAATLRPNFCSESYPQVEFIVKDVMKKAMKKNQESGGPIWEVKLGRLDSLTASQEDSNQIMPSPRSNATYLIDLFSRFNLSVQDLVALSGSHSTGKGKCFSIVFRLYNQSGSGRPDPTIEPRFREKLDKLCPLRGDGNVTGVDLDATPEIFDNQYFKDIVNARGF
ncbi:hypothetical protein K7X08_025642 [Anisodus acutangulus]|uniref:peroxidase n=1 Tax=Anisodus acutangulus TaxID=402998 RepID=A0A9Q1R7V4_9SOLA|nr:hypothetical protein K7X08_025642 [Anisodus acutangulus]